MRKFFQILLAAVLVSLTALTSAANFDGEEYIEAEGVVYPEGQKNLNNLRRIAIMDAYRYLSERVNDLHVSSNSTVKNLRDLDEEINTKVEGVLRGAEVVSVNRAKDGSFHAIVRLYMHGAAGSLASAVLKEDIQIEDFPPPKFTPIVSTNYSGLIIDCRGKNLAAAITPAIKSADGTEIFSYKNIGYQAAVKQSVVDYSTNINSGVERAGDSPLIVKAVSVSGDCDVVVSVADADKILAANRSTHFLNNCAVVLMR